MPEQYFCYPNRSRDTLLPDMSTAVGPRKLTEDQQIAAEMLGQSIPRPRIYAAIKAKRAGTISEWLQIPEFQAVVAQSNREYIHELKASNMRLVQRAQDVVEAILNDPKHPQRDRIAWEIVRLTLGSG